MKKYFIGISLVLLLGLSSVAMAEDGRGSGETEWRTAPIQFPGQQMGQMPKMEDRDDRGQGLGMQGGVGIIITPSKQVMVQGKVTANSGSSLTVSVFGLSINVNVASASSTGSLISQIAVGDSVAAKGTIDENSGVITANAIRDLTQSLSQANEIQKKIQDLMNQIKQLQAQLHNQGGTGSTTSH